MSIERFKDVTINGHQFRLGLVNAMVGNWMTIQMSAGKASDLDTYNRMQNYFFNECSVYRGEPPVPMQLYHNGRWMVPDLELEYDLDTVNALFWACADFNFTPFFKKREEERKLSETQVTIP